MPQRSSPGLTAFLLLLMLALPPAAHAVGGGDFVIPATREFGAPAEDNVMRDLAAAACAYAQAQLENMASMLGGTGVIASMILCAMASQKAA